MIKEMVVVMKKYFNVILLLVIIFLMIILAIWISDRLIQHLDQKIPDVGMSGPVNEKEDWNIVHFNFQ